jgi:hypothetical protein
MFKMIIPALVAFCLSTNALAKTKAPDDATDAKSPAAVSTTDSLRDLDALQAAVTDAWQKMPLTVRRVLFVTEKPPMIGSWTERPSNVFKAGEPMLTYMEPVGYTWKANGDRYDLGLTTDFVVRSVDGKILGGQENFAKIGFTNRLKIQEMMVNLTMTLDAIPPGNYVLVYKLHDLGSDKTASVEQPFVIVK